MTPTLTQTSSSNQMPNALAVPRKTIKIDAMGNVLSFSRRASVPLVHKRIYTKDLETATLMFGLVGGTLLVFSFLIVTYPEQSQLSSEFSHRNYLFPVAAAQVFELPPFPAYANVAKIPTIKADMKSSRVDNDKALQLAFDTEFTCSEVVTADASQCDEQDGQGNTVQFYCSVSCKDSVRPSLVESQTASIAPVMADGSYYGYNLKFTQCAAVGSREGSCSSPASRNQGCACSSSAQCAAQAGSKCCYHGFCSYEHLAPLAPCL